MSRLQKKKISEKKKRKNALKKSVAPIIKPAAKPAGVSGSKSTALTSLAKSEKSLADTKAAKPNFFQKAIIFLKEVKAELTKVTWPTRKQTMGTTLVVIVFVFVVSAFLGLFDYSLSKLVQVVLT